MSFAFTVTAPALCASVHRVPRCSVSKPPEEPRATDRKRTVTPSQPPTIFETLSERTLDTIDDVALHYGRLFRREEPLPTGVGRPRIVVLGSGWAAHSFIKVIDASKYDVTVISPRNFYFFTPLLAATAVGTIEFRSVVDPIRRANPLVNFYEAACTGVDLDRNEVQCIPVRGGGDPERAAVKSATESFNIAYDYLLVTVGEKAGTFGVPGVATYAHFLKEIGDSVRLRRAIVQAFEAAALPGQSDEDRRARLHFVVTGGGATGCEFAGELSDFVLRDLRAKYPALLPLTRVTLLQSRNALLTTFEARLQARALDNFYLRRVDVRLNVRVINVTKDAVHLSDGVTLRYGVLVWAAGNAPRDITTAISNAVVKRTGEDAQPPPRRKLTVDSWLRVQGANRVFALGDCASFVDGPLPATAQVAGQQGAYMARAFRKWSRIRETQGAAEDPLAGPEDVWADSLKPFRFLSLGVMTYIGDEKALVQLGGSNDAPKVAFSGFVSYLLWLSTYAVKQVATRNRVLVLFDWFKTRAFGRDLSQF